ncbi:MAG: hypothetical protein LUF34_09205 [Lachnospiraceae bacterium]|nr:hypothetical protein [Lachnospiraceae bacterium]
MNAADYEKMAEQFDGNVTMIRLLSKYVREYADQIKDNAERSRMYQLADRTAHGQSRKEREWETLTNAARTYSGRRASDNPEPGFVVAMAKKWDDEPAQEAISNF